MTPQELKASILQLAIQGKLVEQRPEEGTGAELLEKILATKNTKGTKKNSHAESRSRGERTAFAASSSPSCPVSPGSPVPPADAPFDIPESWVWVRIADCCIDVFSGKSPVYVKTETPYKVVGQAANQQQGLDFSQIKYTTKDFWSGMAPRYFLRENDVLLNTLGNGTLGRSGIVGELPYQLLTDGHLFVFRLKDKTQSQFFYYYLQLRREEIEKNANGSTNQTFLSLGKALKWLIPLPPLAEQKRIVAKIEELLPYIDRYEKAWSKLEDFNKRFPGDMQKSLLQMAIQGKLVDQRPEEGTGEELYRQIQSEKQRLIKSGKIKKEKPLPEITPDKIPFDIPESWKWVRFGDLGNYKKGPFGSAITKSMFIPKGNGAIKVYEQKNAIRKDATLGDYYIPTDYFEAKMKGFELCPGDIIVSCAGTIGETYVMPEEFEQGIINQALMRMRIFKPLFIPYFLMFFDFMLKRSARSSSKGSAIKNIPPFEIMKNYLVPIPPLVEQKRIVAKLEELLPLCERLK